MLLSATGGIVMAMASDLIVLFLGLETLSIALYVLAGERPAPEGVAGGVDQVLRARRHSRRPSSSTASPSSTARPVRRTSSPSPSSSPTTCCSRTGCCWPGSRCCSSASASRSRRCRSTPGRPTCTRARPRRSPAFMAVSRQGRRLRRAVAGLRRDVRDLPARLEADGLGAGRAHHGRRLRARRRADRREADARVLVDQPRRLRPRRRAGGQRAGHRGGALLPAGLHVHGAGLVRDRRARRAARRFEPRPRARSRGCPAGSRHSRSRSRCSCSPRPACRSRPASSPSST